MEKQTLFQKLLNEENYKTEIKTEGVKHSMNVKIPLMIITILVVSFFFVFQIDKSSIHQDKVKDTIWQQSDLIAEFTYPVFKSEEKLFKERKEARDKTNSVFQLSTEYNDLKEVYYESVEEQILKYDENTDADVFSLTDENDEKLISMNETEKKRLTKKVINNIKNFLNSIYKNGFIDVSLEKNKYFYNYGQIKP